jgi:glycosyltransferase involved in cell wall biosynthesis
MFSVLHIGKYYPPHQGGMESHLRDLAVRQTRVAHVNVIVANAKRQNECCVTEGVSVTRVARIANIASMPICPGLSAAIRRTPADLVHIHMPNPGAALAFLRSGHVGRVIITHHADTLGRQFLRQFSDPFVIRLMHRASRIIVTSNRYLNSSLELIPFHDKCRVIPLGIDIQRPVCADPAAVRGLRQQFGDRLLLAVGRLVPYKGFDILIRSMKHIEGRLILIGAGPQSSALASLAASERVQGKVSMLGRVEDLGPYFAAASVFVLPSINRAEAFGMVQLEAMAAGLPVVNTDIDSGAPEVSLDGITGLTVPPSDPVSLARAVTSLLGDRDLQLKMGDAGRKRVREEFSVEQMSARTMHIYDEILERERAAMSECQ